MNDYIFDWDKNKEKLNIKKHGINFKEAASVFADPDALYSFDDLHSDNEERFIVLGMSITAKILIVCHCYQENDSVVRIISAHKADKKESKKYFGGAI